MGGLGACLTSGRFDFKSRMGCSVMKYNGIQIHSEAVAQIRRTLSPNKYTKNPHKKQNKKLANPKSNCRI